jgi:DNA-binding transcriptional LysR family regulator
MTSIFDSNSVNIDYTNLRKLDLNLLIALNVLIEEASVTKAAQKLEISQSSMSHALKRLRTVLDDEILIRTSREMEITPYAREIGDRVRQILAEIQVTLLEKETFDPAIAREDFYIAMSDYVEISLGVPLLQKLTESATGIRIRTSNVEKGMALEALDNNQIDLAISVFSNLKSWHVREKLYEEEFVCVVHSGMSSTFSLEEYLQRPHILVSSRDDFLGTLDSLLEAESKSRHVMWSTPHFMTVPLAIANSECVSLLPKRLAERCAKKMDLEILPPPIEITGFTVSMVWHQRNTARPKHQWLRDRLLEIARNI